MSDDDPIRDQPPAADRPPPPTAVDDGVRVRPPVKPLELPPPRRTTDLGASGCRRPALVGTVALALVLVMLLVIGVKLTRRTMWLTAERAMERVRREALEAPLAPAERDRLLAALRHFQERLPLMSDPFPVIGTFLGRVQADLADGRLSREEALALTELLEPLALGARLETPSRAKAANKARYFAPHVLEVAELRLRTCGAESRTTSRSSLRGGGPAGPPSEVPQ